MASFTEQATLKVVDQSSSQIRKINAELKKLATTANSLKSRKIDFNVDSSKLTKAQGELKKLAAGVNQLRAARVNISANTTGLAAAQRQLQTLRSQAARPISQSVTGRIAGAASHLSSATLSALGHAVAHAAKEGVNDASVGEAALRLKQLPDDQYAAAKKAITQIGDEKSNLPGGAFFSSGQRTRQFSEALGVTNNDVQAAKFLTGRMEELTRSAVALGQSMEAADEGAISYAKAAEQMGRTTFHDAAEAAKVGKKVGDFNEEGARKTFEFFQKLQPTIGKEMTGPFVQRMVKYLGQGKQAIPDSALAHVLMLGEEEGTRAAVGYRQAAKQLAGKNVQKAQLENLRAEGLVGTKEVTSGGIEGGKRRKRVTTTTAAEPVTEEGKAFQKAVRENDLPKAAQFLAKRAEKFGLDLTKAGDVGELVSRFVSDTTARETLSALIYRGAEYQQKVNEALKRDASDLVVRRLLASDVRTTLVGLNNQLQTVTSEAIMGVAPMLTPVAQYASEQMRTAGKAFAAAGPDFTAATEATIATGVAATEGRTGDAAAHAARAAALTEKAGKKFYDEGGVGALAKAGGALAVGMKIAGPMLNRIADVSLMRGVLSGDPLSAAAWKLDQAADKLSGAADKQQSWVDWIKDSAAAKVAWDVAKAAVPFLGRVGGPLAAGAAAGYAGYQYYQWMKDKSPGSLDQSQMATSLLRIVQADLAAAQRARATSLDEGEKAGLGVRINELTAQIGKLESDIAYMEGETKPTWIDETLRQLQQVKPPGADVFGAPPKIPPKPYEPPPGWKPFTPGDLKPVTDAAGSFTAFGRTMELSSSSFAASAAMLPAAQSSFQSIFSVGATNAATAITGAGGIAGQTATDIIAGGAANAGAAYGNAAAAAIAAAAASVSINVNTNAQSKPDTGASKP